ncbi:MAG TPA: OadG family protein [Bellilinea sp.]|nr:OadG family protein [Bellilinea sp.]
MTELLNQGLLIAAIGMGLVFLALILLWGLMASLGRIPVGRKPAEETAIAAETPAVEAVEAVSPDNSLRIKAAAAAVAIALGLQKSATPTAPKSPNAVSSWLVARRSSQFNQNAVITNRKSRGSAR